MKAIGKHIILKEIYHEPEPGKLLLLNVKTMHYEALSVGDDTDWVSEGDVVHFNSLYGYKMHIAGMDYVVIKEEDVMAVTKS